MNTAYKGFYEDLFRAVLAQSPPGAYDESALPSYTHPNRLMSWLFWRRVTLALKLSNAKQKPGKALDFGCGGGVTFKFLADAGAQVVGCDNASDALAQEVCRRLNVPGRIVRSMNELQEETFDWIFALDVLEHIEDLSPILAEFKRLSHPGTRIILSGPTENWVYKLGRLLAGFSGHYHVSNIYQIEKAFQKAGLKRFRSYTLYWPAPLFRISSWGWQ